VSDRDLISGPAAPARGPAEARTPVGGAAPRRTARRAVERERDDARDLFETAFSYAAIGMALVGLNGRWLKVNRAICRMTGWSQEELLERSFQDLTHPDDLSADLALMQQLIGGEIDEYSMEKRYLTRGGGNIWALLAVSLVRDEYGQPKHLIAQVQDVDDRKRTERRLLEIEAEVRQERDHARTILAAMHEGYALTDNGEIVDVNDALCEMTGLRRQDLIGCRPPYPFWPAERVRELLRVRGEAHAGTGGTFEAVFIRADGTRFDAEVTAIPAFGADGALIGFVNTMRDVSLRNLQRRELERRARTDSLTGLSNRYVLDEELERATLGRAGEMTALVLFDLDRFKQINDEHGHPAGDAVLVEVAARLSRIARESEVLARVGGEEFAWLLSGCDEVGARVAADRARAEIASAPFGEVGAITLSAGIGVSCTPCNPARLYALADRALYQAKRSGRNRTRCYRDPAAADGAASGSVSSVSPTSAAAPGRIPRKATTKATAIAAAMPMTTTLVAEAKSTRTA
jgi:diguanylate cyclase (GGDEF)-like protein/PAS domain S-box-containing protein